MGRKRQGESRDVLQFKLQVLHDYISHKERQDKQLRIDTDLALLKSPPGVKSLDADVRAALDKFLTAPPSLSLIGEDLMWAASQIDAVHADDSRVEKIKQALVQLGLSRREVQSEQLWKGGGVRERCLALFEKTFNDYDGDPAKGRQAMRLLLDVMFLDFELDLEPLRLLRQRWVDALAGKLEIEGRKKVGRPKNPEIAQRDQQMFEVWQTKQCRTWADLGKKFGISGEAARKAVARIRRKLNRTGGCN